MSKIGSIMDVITTRCESRWVSASEIIRVVKTKNVERGLQGDRLVTVADVIFAFVIFLDRRYANGMDCRLGPGGEVQWTHDADTTELGRKNHSSMIKRRFHGEVVKLKEACRNIVDDDHDLEHVLDVGQVGDEVGAEQATANKESE
jgi:hypothetical protein